MNRKQLQKTKHFRIRIRPVAQRFDNEARKLDEIDDIWLVKDVVKEGIMLNNIRTDYSIILPYDHIREFMTDPEYAHDGLKHGFLLLKSQLELRGSKVEIEPLYR